ncbi:DUF4032 domain-containing protein [Arsenicicoccus piscis]|uniref:DUF4032 domain-containing protein n=1 Tax=Arsenicicoccus piscis TaxID=673954 RepID=UPI001F4D100E|nr:DUF4032 domain-containing protein [Arsenicicoccus piscis]MCH8627911.1 DUF4032 domain-containing protein [Arsenicicoccus piscis]
MLQITTIRPAADIYDLPWSTPLEDWPEDLLAVLPRGISRHTVRFVRTSQGVIAVKEIKDDIAYREYHLLRALGRLDIPCVQPFGIVSGRTDDQGNPLDGALLTYHLQYSLPFRALFSQALRQDTARRLIDALAVLLVRLHLQGFWWGDVSLSNTLFRRDAGEFAAYLVDAETGELRDQLSDGQREHDLEIARINIAGELLDLEAGGLLPPGQDPLEIAVHIMSRYAALWSALTETETYDTGERWRVDERIRRLNDLGFDVGELSLTTDLDGSRILIQPKVVDAGHHSRRLLRLTGLDVGEGQARRLLNDLDSFRASINAQGEDEAIVANQWLNQIYLPVTRTAHPSLIRKLEPAELFHEVLEHRWYLSERLGHDIPIEDAVRDYTQTILPSRADEQTVVDADTQELDLTEMFSDDDFDEVELDQDGNPVEATGEEWTADDDDSAWVLNDWNPDWRTRD